MATDFVLPVVTLVLGYLGREFQESMRARRAEAKERRRRREDFERDALVELQEVLFSLVRNAGRAYNADLATFRQTGRWGRALLPEELDREHFTLNRRAGILRERVFDAALRSLVDEIRGQVAAAGIARDKPTADSAMDVMAAAFDRGNRSLGDRLRALYDA